MLKQVQHDKGLKFIMDSRRTVMGRDRDIARDVLLLESRAIQAIAESLNETFDRALDILFQTQGKVVVSGVGKSGHIGRKIAATLASTGQPSFFLHAAEAGHGDLGMIAQGDTLLLLSYSGEASELTPLVNYAHRLSLPIISITGKSQSTLCQTSTVGLVLSPLEEACPMGLAPTTSTTATLALGDALAVSLLKRRGFSKHDFGILHPLGRLGAQLRRVKDVMHTNVPLIQEGFLMQDGILTMTSGGLGCLGVVSSRGDLLGIITDGDLRRHMAPNLLSQTVESMMTSNPVVINPNALVADALAIMEEKSITSVFVIDENRTPLGLIHIHDCLRSTPKVMKPTE